MTQLIAIDQIHSNPWQTRLSDDPEHIQRLADDIKINGVLQTPLARALNGHFELAFGHSRLAAWKLAHPGEPFEIDVKPLSDRQLSDYAASENAQRRNLSAIETATAIQRRMADFKLSQLEAGKPFGYASQGSISNLLRLLNLPEHTRQLVHKGEIPERIGRMLIPVARMNQTAADQIADGVLLEKPGERDDRAETMIRIFLDKTGRPLDWRTPWKLEWPLKPLQVPPDMSKGIGGAPAEVPACTGCEFRAEVNRRDVYCTRPPCHAVKLKMYVQHDLQITSKRLGIAIAGPDEKVSMVYDGSGYDQSALKRAKSLVASKAPIFRLSPIGEGQLGAPGSYREEVFGSKNVVLVTTDKAEAAKLMASKSGAQEARRLTEANETDAQKAKRQAREEEAREAGRLERSKQFRARADINWLIRTAGEWLGKQIDARAGALEFLAQEVAKQYWQRGNTSLFDADTVAHRKELGELLAAATDVRSGGKAREALLRQRIVVDVLAHKIAESYQDPWYGWLRAKEVVAKVTEQEFNAKLPANWNQPPVHHGKTNCWDCGRFGSNVERITKGEEAAGWIVGPDGVFCSLDHQKAYHAAAAPKAVKAARTNSGNAPERKRAR